jgi:amino acid adenylation domain-containing protein/non-ribosomal peptide synthase protein (TIGR01720 family)
VYEPLAAFALCVAEKPASTAVVSGDQCLTFAELDEQANRLAHALIERGTRGESVVGLAVDRGPAMVVGILGILKANSAYLPLEPSYPDARLAWMAEDAGIRLVVTETALADRFPGQDSLLIDDDFSAYPAHAPDIRSRPENAAYLMYTSGSTGPPKGVVVEHRNLAHVLSAWDEMYGLRADPLRFVSVTGLAVDLFFADLLRSVFTGGTLIIAPSSAIADPHRLLELIAEHDGTAIETLPALAKVMARAGKLPPLRLLSVGSEGWPAEDFRELAAGLHPDTVVVNAFGATETTVDSCVLRPDVDSLGDSAFVPIGAPIARTKAYVLDSSLKPVAEGELYISGHGVARGYHNRAGLSSSRFVADPFAADGTRMYRTGDLARRRADGILEFLGRADDQVKIRGFRIELGEIENALLGHPAVRRAAVIAVREAASTRLAGYVEPEGVVTEGELRSFLIERLPLHMVPAMVRVLDRLPLLANGKLDRRALPAAPRPAGTTNARTELERALAEIWADVLGVPQVGIHDNFFDLGGDSILGIQVASATRINLGLVWPYRALFDRPTVAELATVLTPAGQGATRQAGTTQLPLSFAQEPLWFLHTFQAGSDYNLGKALRLTGPLDVPALTSALTDLVERQDALRTTFHEQDGRGVQVVGAPRPVWIEITDMSALTVSDQDSSVRQLLLDESGLVFDLRKGPLIRPTLVRLGAEDHVLVLMMHHIVTDDWANEILLSELAALYTAAVGDRPAALPELSARYADFTMWQRDHVDSGPVRDQLEYWRTKLDAMTPAEIPPDRPRSTTRSTTGTSLYTVVPAAVARQVRDLSRAKRVSLFTTLVAAVQVLFARYSRSDDVAVGTAESGRGRPEWAELVGFFVNTVVIRSTVDQTRSFADFLGEVRETVLDAMTHADVPFGHVVRALAPDRDPAAAPLVHTMVVMQNAPARDREFAGLSVAEVDVPMVNANFDMTFEFRETGDDLRLLVNYNTDLYDTRTVELVAESFKRLLADVAAFPEQPMRLLGPVAKPAQLPAKRVETCVHELFEHWAHRVPDMPAVVHGNTQLTYRELGERADSLAAWLVAQGVSPEVPVGVRLARTPELIVAMLAVLKAGGVLVPLDPGHPSERLDYIVHDLGVTMVLTEDDLPPHSARSLIAPAVSPKNLAYVVYTSGSTGEPNGVAVTHDSVVANALDAARRLGFGPTARILLHLSVGFDGGLWQAFMALLTGATLCLSEVDEPGGTITLTEQINRDGITVLPTTSSLLSTIDPDDVPGVEVVYSAAESCPPALAAKWLPERAFGNLYGPTETTMTTTAFVTSQPVGGVVPIGVPIEGVRCDVLDRYLRPVPAGMEGELYIAGGGVARGYAGRPMITADRFVADPFGAPGERMYRSGDLVRRRADGTLEFRGRVDDQVKIRGFRIEPGEIEAALVRHPDVADAVVVPRGNLLLAYVVSTAEPTVLVGLRRFLEDLLPGHMIPSSFVVLDELPLTRGGKVDRSRLPEPEQPARAGHVSPRTPVEHALADAWSSVLGIERIGVQDNFFELGGDSILSIQVVAALNRAGLRITSRDVFRHQTIDRLATVVATDKARVTPDDPATGPIPLTPIQQWFFETFDQHPDHFTMPRYLELDTAVDEQAVRMAVQAVVEHHDALRTRARQVDGEWRLAVGTDLGEFWARAQTTHDEVERLVEVAHGELSLTGGPLFKAIFYDLGAGNRPRLLLMAHHMVVDGVSWRILLSDLATAYSQAVAGEPVTLGPKTTSMRRWARRLRDHVRSGGLNHEIGYWSRQAVLPKPAAEPVSTTEHVTVRLSRDETRSLLREVPAAYRTQPNDVLLSALASVLAEDGRLRVNLEGHGREHLFGDVDVSRTVGWFTTQFPVTLELPASRDWGDVLKAVKEQLRAVPGHGLGHDALRYLSVRSPLPAQHARVNFNYLGQFAPPDRTGSFYSGHEFPVTDGIHPAETRPFELEVTGEVTAGELVFTWDYSRTQHDRAEIQAVAGRMLAALRAITAHCRTHGGRTPSDFPLARLDQDTVDSLLGDGRHVEDVYALSKFQAGLLYHTLSDYENDVYARRIALEVEGVEDPRALADAWRHVVAATPALRSTVHWEGPAEPVQIVHRDRVPEIELHDWRSMSGGEQRERLTSLSDDDRAARLDLRVPIPLRLTIVRLTDSRVYVLLVTHHLFIDGWSVSRLLADVFAACAAITNGQQPEPAVQRPLRDYVEWLSRQDEQAALGYWSRELADFDTPTPLPYDRRPAPGYVSRMCQIYEVKLPAGIGDQVRGFARANGLTVNTIIQAAWAVLLARHAGVNDVLYGVTVSTRPADLPGVETVTGPLINTLAARIRVEPGAQVSTWLRHQQERQAEAREFDFFPLARQHSISSVAPGVQLFDSAIAVENYPGDLFAVADHGIRLVDLDGGDATNYPLSLLVYPGDEITLVLNHDPELFDDSTIDRLAGHLTTLIAGLTDGVARRVADVPMLVEQERSLVLDTWSRSTLPGRQPQTCQDIFAGHVRRSPDALAIIGDEQLTYAQLDARANRLAHKLIDRGAGPEVFVGLRLGHRAGMLVGVLAILKSGAAYVPIDPSLPAERQKWMLDDAGATIVIDEAVIDETLAEGLGGYPDTAPEVQGRLDHAAYMIYTSGSTGTPKGVIVTHAGAANLVSTMEKTVRVTPGARVLHWLSTSFDAAFFELCMSLFSGATAVVSTVQSTADLPDIVAAHGVTHLVCPPTAMATLPADRMSGLTVVSGGEVCTAQLVETWSAAGRIHNAYGPTEVTVCSSITGSLTGSATPSIGRPIAGARTFVLDEQLNPVPVGAVGEIYLVGPGLARGYHTRPGLTAGAFVACPFEQPGTRMYRTGDLGRWDANGELRFAGRTDDQVKIRGHRVELGEVEAALLRHPEVRQAAVIAVADGPARRLVAYVVTEATEAQLRALLTATMPDYLVPSQFVVLEGLPLTVNGKIDRAALPVPGAQQDVSQIAPRTPMERAVAEVWEELIGRERIGVREKFFEAGGSSLTLVQLSGRLTGLGKGEVTVGELLDHSTIEEMAARLDADPAGGPGDFEL